MRFGSAENAKAAKRSPAKDAERKKYAAASLRTWRKSLRSLRLNQREECKEKIDWQKTQRPQSEGREGRRKEEVLGNVFANFAKIFAFFAFESMRKMLEGDNALWISSKRKGRRAKAREGRLRAGSRGSVFAHLAKIFAIFAFKPMRKV